MICNQCGNWSDNGTSVCSDCKEENRRENVK